MTKLRYPQGCAARSQVHGDAGSSRSFFYVNMNNGNVNNNNANNRLRARPVRRAAPASECQGGVTVRQLHDAMCAARRRKKPSANQLAFELAWMDRLIAIEADINAGRWSPAPATCFVATRPKAREIHAPDFGDRVVHHWLVPQLEAIYEPTFIHDSYANRKRKGSHAAVLRLRQFVRQTVSGEGGGWYLQLDVHNFFNSIHRPTLWLMLKDRLTRANLDAAALRVVHALLRHPVERQGVHHRATAAQRAMVPAHKRLENAAPGCGLPIGNLSSQFFANVYLDALDQFVKHTLKARRYARYVDDFVLVHRDRAVLEQWQHDIETFLGRELGLKLKADIRLRPLSAGIDFLGYVVYPTHTRVRARVLQHMTQNLAAWAQAHSVRHGFAATPADIRSAGSILASFDGHLRHANAARVRLQILSRFPWASRIPTKASFAPALEGTTVLLRHSHS
ncbi:Group II intron-encoded protein LtrA [Dyella sp. AD56]|uniref:RNA-directed DNA polymerase n=1 Tax=Dyella sp. AD56 TaxID=1528744 RepID=UPI000C82E74D|nr:RNA-directed DNA polymerase [Dyella sp. AD56]PMQ04206.1 Group II intron-encoded protein LtrA [Dyella sp. AD56]